LFCPLFITKTVEVISFGKDTAAFFVNLPVLPTTTEQAFLPKSTETFLKMGAKKQQIFLDLLLVCRCDGRRIFS
jgi:hypothetical protein